MEDRGKMPSPKQKALSDVVPPASEQILALKRDTSNTHTCLDNTSPVLLNKPILHSYTNDSTVTVCPRDLTKV